MGRVSTRIDRFTMRSYTPGDEAAVVELFHAAYSAHGGYVPRDVEHWRWCILERPGMDPDNIRVMVDDEGEMVAYGVLSDEGAVLELAVTPDVPPDQRRGMAAALLASLEERCRELGLESIQADLPLVDQPIREAAEAAGYRMEPAESLQLVVVDLVALLEPILEARAGALEGLDGRAILLQLSPGGCRFLSHERMLIRSDRSRPLKPAATVDPNAVPVETDLVTLMTVIFQGRDPGELIRSGRVKVAPENRAAASTLLEALALSNPWYIPNADGR